MDGFWKASAGALIAAIVYLVLSKRDKDFGAVLTIAVCCMIASVAMSYLQQVKAFVYALQSVAQMDENLLTILFKAVAVGITAQIAEHVCTDAGNSALGKTLQFLASIAILLLSLPLMESLLNMISAVLEKG